MQRPIPASTNNILEGHLQGLYYSTLSNLLAFQHCLTVCTVWSEGLLNVKKKNTKRPLLIAAQQGSGAYYLPRINTPLSPSFEVCGVTYIDVA